MKKSKLDEGQIRSKNTSTFCARMTASLLIHT